jgi:hypothetical protein
LRPALRRAPPHAQRNGRLNCATRPRPPMLNLAISRSEEFVNASRIDSHALARLYSRTESTSRKFVTASIRPSCTSTDVRFVLGRPTCVIAPSQHRAPFQPTSFGSSRRVFGSNRRELSLSNGTCSDPRLRSELTELRLPQSLATARAPAFAPRSFVGPSSFGLSRRVVAPAPFHQANLRVTQRSRKRRASTRLTAPASRHSGRARSA